jgi:hypothetical protein
LSSIYNIITFFTPLHKRDKKFDCVSSNLLRLISLGIISFDPKKKMQTTGVSFAFGTPSFEAEERSSVLFARKLVDGLGMMASVRLVSSLSETQLGVRKEFLQKKAILKKIVEFGSGDVLTCDLTSYLTKYTGKTFKKTPEVECKVVVIPKDKDIEVGETLTERWQKMQVDAKEELNRLSAGSASKTSDWVGTLMRKDWGAFLVIVRKYTLDSKPHEWDEWVGRNWRTMHGNKERHDEIGVSGGKVTGRWILVPKDQLVGMPMEQEVTVEEVWRVAAANRLKLSRQSGFKRSAHSWNIEKEREFAKYRV